MAGRAGQDLPVRSDDHRVARLHPVGVLRIDPPHPFPVREVRRDLVDAHARVHPDHVAASLPGDVPHRRDPAVTPRERRRHPHVDTLGVEEEASERHVVLPADQPADAPEGRLVGVERRPITLAPHRSLRSGRHQLAVLAEELAVGIEVQQRVVDRAARRLSFVDADHQIDTRFPGRRPEAIGGLARHDDGLVHQHLEPPLVAVPDGRPVDPDRRAGHEGLGKHHDVGGSNGGVGQRCLHLGQRRLAIHQHVSSLHGRDRHRRHLCPPLSTIRRNRQ